MGRYQRIGRLVSAALGCLGVLAVASEARAVQYGELHISANTTLTDDRYGDIVFDADNVTLDCAGHQVHISSYTKGQPGAGGAKVAIGAYGRNGITITNCRTVGGFDFSLFIKSSSNVTVRGVTGSTPARFDSNANTLVTGLNLSNAPIALFIYNDFAGRYSASIACVTAGIFVDGSGLTAISNTTVSGCQNEAINASNNNHLLLDHVDTQGNGNGLIVNNDDGDTIRSSVFSNNARYGMKIYDAGGPVGGGLTINNNKALGNGTCDAYELSSPWDTWSNNTFGTTCGTVPLFH